MGSAMSTWTVGELPFVFSMQSERGNAGFPEFLPFCLEVNMKDGFLAQVFDKKTEQVLHRAYSHGSELSGLMEESGNGLAYAEDFLSFINKHSPVQGCRLLEIGCGTGYLLSRLNDLGAEGIGLEPGSHGAAGMSKYGVNILDDFFPSSQLGGKFDLLVSFCVLEHISDPKVFLEAIRSQVADQGRVVLAVPRCEPYLNHGDISFLFHEHWNYFTKKSLKRFLKSVFGGEPVVVDAQYGGSIYAAVKVSGEQKPDLVCEEAMAEEMQQFIQFKELAKKCTERVWSVLEEGWSRGETIGIYVPWRAVNVLSVYHQKVQQKALRFFDDNPRLKESYYPGFDASVETLDDLLANPPDRLLVVSNTFGDAIISKLRARGVSLPIHTWDDFFGKASNEAPV